MRAMRLLAKLLAHCVVAIVLFAPVCLAQTRDKVVVGSKIDAEGALLGQLILIGLQKAGVPVEDRLQLGPTKIVRTALLSGEIDVYPEYTGNGAFFFHQETDPDWKSAQLSYDKVKRLDLEANKLVWLDRAPANNTWLIAVRGDLARRERLATMADFAGLVQRGGVALKLAASAEFVESPAALPSFERTYGFNFPRAQIVVLPGGNTAVTMRAAAQQVSGVNAAMVYGSDGAIAALDLVAMEDTKGAQIVYEPAPVVRAAMLEKHPAIAPTLARIFSSLSLDELRKLNAEVAVEGQQAKDVALRYLQKLH